MLILAIDQSTVRSTAAVLDNETVRASCNRAQERRGQTGVEWLLSLFEQAGVNISEVDLFAAGLGPGSFAGLRISLSTCLGLAAPGGKAVVGVSSAELVAADLMRQTGRGVVTVVGDARRQRLWLGRFEEDGCLLKQTVPFRLVDFDGLAGFVEDGGLLATPDWERIGSALRSVAPAGTMLVEAARLPRAETLGRVVFRRTGGRAPAPGPGPTPGPVYLHPPVFVEPRFSEAAETSQ